MSSIGLPEYNWGANCVHGVQSTCGTNCPTSFPNPVNLGAIFDPQVVFDMAQVIGWELRALWLEGARENYKGGPHLGLDCWSPNINILTTAIGLEGGCEILRKGDYFGEMALLQYTKRTATTVSLTWVQIHVLCRQDLDYVKEQYPTQTEIL